MPSPYQQPMPPRAHTWAGVVGWIMIVVSLLVAALSILFWIEDERKWSEEQEAFHREYDRWEADSTSRRIKIEELQARQAAAEAKGDSLTAMQCADDISAIETGPVPCRQGFPLGGLVTVIFLAFDVIPFAIGVVLLVFYYVRRSKRRMWFEMMQQKNR
ncbi:MAG: hypothetical protein IKR63_02975 [Alloprevotella sp.]|nr:hypothetical protein [Alloprevotella sp.]